MTAAPTATQPSLRSQPASRRRIALNFLGLAGSNVLGLVVTIAISVYVRRVLGPEAIGQVSWAMAAVAWLTVLVSPGLFLVGQRAIARSGHSQPISAALLVGPIRFTPRSGHFARARVCECTPLRPPFSGGCLSGLR